MESIKHEETIEWFEKTIQAINATWEEYEWVRVHVDSVRLPKEITFFEDIRKLVDELGKVTRGNPKSSPARLNVGLANIKNALNDFYDKWKLLLDRISENKNFFEKLRREDDCETALYLMFCLSGLVNACTSMSGTDVLGVSEAMSKLQIYKSGVRAGLADQIKRNSISLNDVEERLQSARIGCDRVEESLKAFSQNYDHWQGRIKSIEKKAEAGIDNLKKEHDEWSIRREDFVKKELGDFVDLQRKEFDLLKKSFEANKALEAPAIYWEKKQKKHRVLSYVFGGAVTSVMVLAFLCMFFAVSDVGKELSLHLNSKTVAHMSSTASAPASSGMKKTQASAGQVVNKTAERGVVDTGKEDNIPETWHFAVAKLLILSTLGFWAVRILVRILLSHIHLENDAAERVVMAKTYLVLLRRGKLPEGDDLKTVLAALFRPSGDGIVKDEGMQLSLMELLTKIK
ncbi:DUF6161 domain-containing protein [Chromobacterium phragmitis]|uniref:DUF6161 domain-containing protein n=3 Tax=Chromobacterium phragmitis TaxID=2202141 RepID=A0ABV0IVI3_9NEIS